MINEPPTVQFACPDCGDVVFEYVENGPVFEPTAEKTSDGFGHTELKVTCPGCSREFVVGMDADPFGFSAVVVDYPDIQVHVEPGDRYAEEEPDLYDYIPSKPWEVFAFAMMDTERIYRDYGGQPRRLPSFNRMLFAQYFSIIEAYLSDRLIKFVMEDEAALAALVVGHADFNKDKIEAKYLAVHPNGFRIWLLEKLRAVSFHKFDRIDEYYKLAMGSSIFPDDGYKTRLMRHLPVRHDCVHRNGRDHDGNLRFITKREIADLVDCLTEVAEHIEDGFRLRKEKLAPLPK